LGKALSWGENLILHRRRSALRLGRAVAEGPESLLASHQANSWIDLDYDLSRNVQKIRYAYKKFLG